MTESSKPSQSKATAAARLVVDYIEYFKRTPLAGGERATGPLYSRARHWASHLSQGPCAWPGVGIVQGAGTSPGPGLIQGPPVLGPRGWDELKVFAAGLGGDLWC